MRSITSAGRKSCSVAVRWAPIVRDRARYHTIEQRPIDIMILGRLIFFFGQGSRSPVPPPPPQKKKNQTSPGLNLRHQIAWPIRSTVLYQLSQIPVYMYKKRFIGGFRRRLSYRYGRPRRMLMMDKQKPYGSSPSFLRGFFTALGF